MTIKAGQMVTIPTGKVMDVAGRPVPTGPEVLVVSVTGATAKVLYGRNTIITVPTYSLRTVQKACPECSNETHVDEQTNERYCALCGIV